MRGENTGRPRFDRNDFIPLIGAVNHGVKYAKFLKENRKWGTREDILEYNLKIYAFSFYHIAAAGGIIGLLSKLSY